MRQYEALLSAIDYLSDHISNIQEDLAAATREALAGRGVDAIDNLFAASLELEKSEYEFNRVCANFDEHGEEIKDE